MPDGWQFNVCPFARPDSPDETEVLIGLNLGLDSFVPTYVPIEEAQTLRDSLIDLPQSGGRFHIGGGRHMGEPFVVRRAGRGIHFAQVDRETSKPTGPKCTIALPIVRFVCEALDDIISAAKAAEKEIKS